MSMAFKSLMLSAVVFFGVVGCNTMEGAGEDIERGGEAIQREAR